jgi:hypothetical protein
MCTAVPLASGITQPAEGVGPDGACGDRVFIVDGQPSHRVRTLRPCVPALEDTPPALLSAASRRECVRESPRLPRRDLFGSFDDERHRRDSERYAAIA